MSAAQRPSPPAPVPPLSLLAFLPEELVLAIARHTFALHLPSCLHLRQCSKELRKVIDAAPDGEGRSVRAEAEARRLRWVEGGDREISAFGLLGPWVHGPLLPVVDKSSWAIEVVTSGYGQSACATRRAATRGS